MQWGDSRVDVDRELRLQPEQDLVAVHPAAVRVPVVRVAEDSRMGTHRVGAVALQVAQANRSQHAHELHRHIDRFRHQGRRLALRGVLARGPLRCFRCFLGALAFAPRRDELRRGRGLEIGRQLASRIQERRPFVDALQLQRVDATPRGVAVEIMFSFSELRVEGVGVRGPALA